MAITHIESESKHEKKPVLTEICQVQKTVSKILFQSDFLCSTLVQRKVVHDIDVPDGPSVKRTHSVDTDRQQ